MNSNADKINTLQAAMLIMAFAGILDHVIVIPMLLKFAGRDSWVSTLLAGVILFGWVLLFYFIMRRTGQSHLQLWLSRRWGSVLAKIFAALVSLDYFLAGTTTLKDVANWANVMYLTKTPNFIIVLAFALVGFYAACSGIRSIAIANGILLPFVVIFGFFVMFSNIPRKDYSLLFPVMEHGFVPVAAGMLYAGAGFSCLHTILFMQHRLNTKIKLSALVWIGLIMIDLTLSPLTGALAEFGPFEAARQRFPAFEEWRLVTFGHYLEHVDFLSIYQWLVGAFVRISLAMYLIAETMNVVKGKKRLWTLIISAALMVVLTQIPFSDMKFMWFMTYLYLPFTLINMTALTVLLAIAAWTAPARKEKR